MQSIPSTTTSTKFLLLLAWVGVVVLGGWLRLDGLSNRPFHFDEATGAKIASHRLEAGQEYQFNPKHHHGPMLSALAVPACWIAGESSWKSMTKRTLRMVPVTAGILLVVLPVFWRRRFGDVPMLVASALLATSPLLVYYSRMFIPEMLLALFGLAALLLIGGRWRPLLFGVCVGLMFSTKESFAISVIAWCGAGGLLGMGYLGEWRRRGFGEVCRGWWGDYRWSLTLFLIAAGLTSGLFYTNGLTHPVGAWDAVRTFFVYQTESGHDKAWSYYMEMLLIPTKGGIWWFELPVAVLALVAVVDSFWPGRGRDCQTQTVRFLTYVILIHLLIYSSISYKTPWLMCLPWVYVCLLAGLSFRRFFEWSITMRVISLLVLSGVLFQQGRLSRYATGRFSSDARNPYAYAPTSRYVDSMAEWMHNLSSMLPPGALEPVAVVGSEYWPLPWYLREFDAIGYWPTPTSAVSECPLVLAMPDTLPEIDTQLKMTHTPQLQSLRSEVPVMIYLRNDYWERWMNSESPNSE